MYQLYKLELRFEWFVIFGPLYYGLFSSFEVDRLVILNYIGGGLGIFIVMFIVLNWLNEFDSI